MLQDTQNIKALCLRLLANREHSKAQLCHKLLDKGFKQEQVEAVIESLAEQDWQNDQRYAENYARYRILKGFGPLRIRYELRQNGIYQFDFAPVLLEMDSTWMELIEQVYLKKYQHNSLIAAAEVAKRGRFLQQRGFSPEMINALFNHLNISNKTNH
ncbi:MAG: regulatory protein RecX [Methylococcaceae bacterium]|jgi:regulatory protein